MFVTKMFKFHVFNFFAELFLGVVVGLHDAGGVGEYFVCFFGDLHNLLSLLLNLLIDHLWLRQQLLSFLHPILGRPFPHISLCRTSWLLCRRASVILRMDWVLRRTFHQVVFEVVLLHRTNIVESIWVFSIALLQLKKGRILLASITFCISTVQKYFVVVSDLLWAWTSIFFKGFTQGGHGIVCKIVVILLCWFRLIYAWAFHGFLIKRLSFEVRILQEIGAVSFLTDLSKKTSFVFFFFQVPRFQRFSLTSLVVLVLDPFLFWHRHWLNNLFNIEEVLFSVDLAI